MKVLFIGDIVGRTGRKLVVSQIPRLRAQFGGLDFVVANGENSAAGFGITEPVAEELFAAGVDVITGGNHIFDKKESVPYLDSELRILRPANYPPMAPGRGYGVYEKGGLRLGVLNLQGRAFMHSSLDCPFRVADALLEEACMCVFVDFHAEATSEKRALGLYLNGRVSALAGTHTHIQTADEELLDGGTAYITDAGMTGGQAGVIGVNYDSVISKFVSGMPSKFEVCEQGPLLCGVYVEIDDETGRAVAISRVRV